MRQREDDADGGAEEEEEVAREEEIAESQSARSTHRAEPYRALYLGLFNYVFVCNVFDTLDTSYSACSVNTRIIMLINSTRAPRSTTGKKHASRPFAFDFRFR